MSKSRWQWIFACGLAEFAGIALAALWWVAMDSINPAPTAAIAQAIMILVKGAAGLIEGIILGFVQATVLRRAYPCCLVAIGLWQPPHSR